MSRRNNKNVVKCRIIDATLESDSDGNVRIFSKVSKNELPCSDNEGDSDELSPTACFEGKFVMALDNATEKSAQTRTEGLRAMCEILVHRYMPGFIIGRKFTLIECIEKSIRHGKGAEQEWGARLATLVVLQLHRHVNASKVLNHLLLTTVQDKAVPLDTRAKCCTALGLLNFLNPREIGNVQTIMEFFEGIFSEIYLRDVEKVGKGNHLHAEALSAWGLLLTLMPPGDFVSLMHTGQMPSIKKLISLLQSSHLGVRMAAGETLALILELGRSHDEEFLEDDLCDMIDAVKRLATDSHKYRAKRDRKTQRATFRDVLHYLEEGISPKIKIHFGTECLVLNSWAIHHQYSSLCVVMGPGMTSQLQENGFVRDIFRLGAKVRLDRCIRKEKQAKVKRHLANAAAFKKRTLTRGKKRDKRIAVFD